MSSRSLLSIFCSIGGKYSLFIPAAVNQSKQLLFSLSLQMLSSLSLKSAIVTYDGSPFFPDVNSLWNVVDKHRVSHLVTSPKYISACMTSGEEPPRVHNEFQLLRTILSTGSPLSSEKYDWIYSNVKVSRTIFFGPFYIFVKYSLYWNTSPTVDFLLLQRNVHLASITGGTDLLSCFALGHPGLPVRRGEIQVLNDVLSQHVLCRATCEVQCHDTHTHLW